MLQSPTPLSMAYCCVRPLAAWEVSEAPLMFRGAGSLGREINTNLPMPRHGRYHALIKDNMCIRAEEI